jgi:hypothetical protein
MSEYRQQMTKTQKSWVDGLVKNIKGMVDHPISGDYDLKYEAFTPRMDSTEVKVNMEESMMHYKYDPKDHKGQISKHVRNFPNTRVGRLSTDVFLYGDDEKEIGYFLKKDVEDDHIIPIELLTEKMILEFQLGICKGTIRGVVTEGANIFYKQNVIDGNAVLTVSKSENRQKIKKISDRMLKELTDWRTNQKKKCESKHEDYDSHSNLTKYYDRLMETYNDFKDCKHYAEADIKLYSTRGRIIMEKVKKNGAMTNIPLIPQYDLYPALGNFIVNEKGKTNIKPLPKELSDNEKDKQLKDKLWGKFANE